MSVLVSAAGASATPVMRLSRLRNLSAAAWTRPSLGPRRTVLNEGSIDRSPERNVTDTGTGIRSISAATAPIGRNRVPHHIAARRPAEIILWALCHGDWI